MNQVAKRLASILLGKGQCLSRDLEIVYAVMTVVDGVVCAVAALQARSPYDHVVVAGATLMPASIHFRGGADIAHTKVQGQLQFFRIHFLIRKWTRQKVFHAMVAISNFGYCLYFLIEPRAVCGGWPCWNNVCGFILLAVPQIVFLATFLLLLSFWVDLCHQASDLDEEEEEEEEGVDEEEGQGEARESGRSQSGSFFSQRQWRLWWKKLRPRGRKAVFVGIVAVICLLTAIFALLIWVGMGPNPINSVAMAELYADLFATLTLFCGGGLAIYGLLLYSKLLRVQSGQTSADLGKVATLAIVCLICFTFRALLVLVNNMRDVSEHPSEDPSSPLFPLLTLSYYLIGESVPSIFVLICLREMPIGGFKSHRRGSFSSLASVEDTSQPLLSPLATGLLSGEASQLVVPPFSVAPPVPPEPDKARPGPTSTLEQPKRAKAHALGSKRPIGRR